MSLFTPQRVRYLGLLTAVLLLAAAWVLRSVMDDQLVFNARDPQAQLPRPAFPHFFERIPALRSVVFVYKGEELRLEKQTTASPSDAQPDGVEWVLPQHHQYPVALPKLRRFLWALADAEIREKKTENPEWYAQLEVDDPEMPDSRAVRVQLYSDSDTHPVVELTVGKNTPNGVTGEKEGFYARFPGDPHVYVLAGFLPLEYHALDWADRQLVHWPLERIASLGLFSAKQKGQPITLSKQSVTDKQFVLQLPTTAPVKKNPLGKPTASPSQFAVDEAVRQWLQLAFLAVEPLGKAGNASAPYGGLLGEAVLSTFDGLSVHFSLYALPKEQDVYAVRVAFAPITPSTPAQDRVFPLKDDAAVAQEYRLLSERHTAWWYRVPAYQVDSLFKSRNDWLTIASDKAIQ